MTRRAHHRRSLLLLALLPLAAACGGDDPPSPGSVSSRNDSPRKDARVDEEDAQVAAPPMPDATVPDAAQPQPPDEDAGPPRCSERQCRRQSDACNVASCNDETGVCEKTPKPNGTACGDPASSVCDAPDSCLAGECAPNHRSQATICGDHDVACHFDDKCNAAGQCIEGGLAASGSPCGSSASSECDQPDTCDALGTCKPNYALEDQPCGTQGVECQWDDRCDASGHCIDRGYWSTVGNCPPGHDHADNVSCSCGTTVESECQFTDFCVEGACQHNYYKPDGTPCNSGTGSCDTGLCN